MEIVGFGRIFVLIRFDWKWEIALRLSNNIALQCILYENIFNPLPAETGWFPY